MNESAQEGTLLWRLIAPLPCSRSLIVGATGSGKSTMECALIHQYHMMHPAHINWIIDPKDRFYLEKPLKDKPIFPDGWGAKVHGKLLSTAIRATLITDVSRPIGRGNNVYVVKSERVALDLIERLFQRADYNRKNMLWFDELLPFCPSSSGRLVYPVRKVLQMGRERGIGAVGISQRLLWLDSAIAAQAGRMYVGLLETRDDLEKLAKMKGIPGLDTISQRMKFWLVENDYEFKIYDRQHGINIDGLKVTL